MNKNKGFSLIELMVVIAIVALLAAVAVPVYKMYVIRAEVRAKVLQPLLSIYPTTTQYYAKHGAFPDSAAINFDTGNFTSYIGNTDLFYQGVNNVKQSPTDCDGVQILGYFSNYDGDGLNDHVSPYGLVAYTFIDVKGVLKSYCNYREVDAATSSFTGRQIIPNCNFDTGATFGADVLSDIQTLCQ